MVFLPDPYSFLAGDIRLPARRAGAVLDKNQTSKQRSAEEALLTESPMRHAVCVNFICPFQPLAHAV